MSKFKAGLIGAIVLIVFTYLGFTKFSIPFVSSPYTVHATFANANQLRPGSLVRIAGVNVGKVQSVGLDPGCTGDSKCTYADVTMTIDNQGLPIHKDATFAIRPRIFLEGNFFVDVHPGTPEAPVAPSGYTFPVQQGVEPVQLDQLLTSLQSDTRSNLQILLQQYGYAVKNGGPAYNASIQYWLPAYKYSAIVSHDFLGYQPHDLSGWIDAQGAVTAALDAHPQNLQNLITDFNRTANAFAVQRSNLEQALAELPRTLAAATPAFNSLNAAFPPLENFANALIPGVQSTGPTIDASLPFITQLRLLVQPSELRGLTQDLAGTPGQPGAVPALAALTQETIPLMNKGCGPGSTVCDGVRAASSCVANVIWPWSQLTLNDSHFNASNGFPPRPVYVEAVDFLPGLAGESRVFDANGPYIRILGALGATGVTSLQNGLLGGFLEQITGFEPKVPPGGHRPPLAGGDIPNFACETQPPITNLSASAAPGPPTYSATNPPPGVVPLASRDRASRSSAQSNKHLTSLQIEQLLEKYGLFSITRSWATGRKHK